MSRANILSLEVSPALLQTGPELLEDDVIQFLKPLRALATEKFHDVPPKWP